MIASLRAMGRDDASPRLLTAGSPELVRPRGRHPQDDGMCNHTGPTHHNPKRHGQLRWQTGPDMCVARKSNLQESGCAAATSALGRRPFSSTPRLGVLGLFELLADFPWQSSKDSHLGALLDALGDVDCLLSKASRGGSLLIRRQNMRIQTNLGPVIGAPVLPLPPRPAKPLAATRFMHISASLRVGVSCNGAFGGFWTSPLGCNTIWEMQRRLTCGEFKEAPKK